MRWYNCILINLILADLLYIYIFRYWFLPEVSGSFERRLRANGEFSPTGLTTISLSLRRETQTNCADCQLRQFRGRPRITVSSWYLLEKLSRRIKARRSNVWILKDVIICILRVISIWINLNLILSFYLKLFSKRLFVIIVYFILIFNIVVK